MASDKFQLIFFSSLPAKYFLPVSLFQLLPFCFLSKKKAALSTCFSECCNFPGILFQGQCLFISPNVPYLASYSIHTFLNLSATHFYSALSNSFCKFSDAHKEFAKMSHVGINFRSICASELTCLYILSFPVNTVCYQAGSLQTFFSQ